MDQVLIHHPTLGRTVSVPATVAPAWCAEGWEIASVSNSEVVANAHVSAETENAVAAAASAEIASAAIATIRHSAGDVEPPRAGRGSSVESWIAYADSIGIQVADDSSRDDVIAAVDAGSQTATADAVETATIKENN